MRSNRRLHRYAVPARMSFIVGGKELMAKSTEAWIGWLRSVAIKDPASMLVDTVNWGGN